MQQHHQRHQDNLCQRGYNQHDRPAGHQGGGDAFFQHVLVAVPEVPGGHDGQPAAEAQRKAHQQVVNRRGRTDGGQGLLPQDMPHDIRINGVIQLLEHQGEENGDRKTHHGGEDGPL